MPEKAQDRDAKSRWKTWSEEIEASSDTRMAEIRELAVGVVAGGATESGLSLPRQGPFWREDKDGGSRR